MKLSHHLTSYAFSNRRFKINFLEIIIFRNMSFRILSSQKFQLDKFLVKRLVIYISSLDYIFCSAVYRYKSQFESLKLKHLELNIDHFLLRLIFNWNKAKLKSVFTAIFLFVLIHQPHLILYLYVYVFVHSCVCVYMYKLWKT